MTTYIALLRAVNVAGQNLIGMPALCDFVRKLGFADAKSLLQSGNLVFRGEKQTGAQLEALLEREAAKLVDQLVALGSFDAVTQLAEVYPLKVFGDVVGLPEEGRENLLPYANMVFNAFGPRNQSWCF